MNTGQKAANVAKKKNVKTLPGIDIPSSTYGILPPPPPPLPLPSSGIRSPRDTTEIMINGNVVNIDNRIEKRVNQEEKIKPLTPPPMPTVKQPIYKELQSPTFIPNNIRIIDTPQPVKPVEKVQAPDTPVSYLSEESPMAIAHSVHSLSDNSTTISTPPPPKKNLKSMLPTFKKPVREAESLRTPETQATASPPPPPIPMPVFNNKPRIVSPIQTVGAKSPLLSKPDFNEFGKSKTPMRNMQSPLQRVVAPVSPVIPQEDSFTGFGGMKPDFSKITPEQALFLRSEYKVKFGILRSNYPQWNVIEPHDSLTIAQLHDLYNHYLHQILVSRETGQYKVYMVLFLMAIEVVGVKLLKLNMSGYTMSQLRIMNRYDSLFTELGEKWLVEGSSSWPIEARLVMTMLFNAVIFLTVRYLCTWIGIEGMADTLQHWIDSMLNGPSVNNSTVPTGTVPMKNVAPVNGGRSESAAEESNPMDKIANMFGNFMSGNSGNIGEKIAQFGTMFSSKIQNENKQKTSAPTNVPNKTKVDKKKLFSD